MRKNSRMMEVATHVIHTHTRTHTLSHTRALTHTCIYIRMHMHMQFCTVLNRLLRKDAEARRRKLRLRTLSVMPLMEGKKEGGIEE